MKQYSLDYLAAKEKLPESDFLELCFDYYESHGMVELLEDVGN